MSSSYLDVQEKTTVTMVGTDVSGTCGRDGNVSPELLLRLRAPVDHRFDNLGYEISKERVRETRKDTRNRTEVSV